METVSNLQEEIARLEQERLVYLNHIYQLAASGRSVVSENKMLRARLEALQLGASSLVRRSLGTSSSSNHTGAVVDSSRSCSQWCNDRLPQQG